MVRQVVAGLWLLAWAVLSVHANARGKLHRVEVEAGGSVHHMRMARHEQDYKHSSPGLETLLGKLGMQTSPKRSVDSERDDEERDERAEIEQKKQDKRERRQRMRDEEERERDAEAGELLEEQYKRKQRERSYPPTDTEERSRPHLSRRAEDDDDGEDDRHYHRRSREEDDEEDSRPSHTTHKYRRRPSEEADPEPEREEAHGRDDDDDTLIQQTSRRDVSEEEDELPSRRTIKEEDQEAGEDVYRRHKHVEAEDEERPRTRRTSEQEDRADDEDVRHTKVAENIITAGKSGYAIGETIRAYHAGHKAYEGGKVLANHEDGKVVVNWDSGDLQNRVVAASDVSRAPRGGSNNPMRFEGPNAYDLMQEKANRVSAALKPSAQAEKLFDGYTLLAPSELPGSGEEAAPAVLAEAPPPPAES